MRGNDRRRSSIPDARVNHNAFASNRNNFRDPINRESSREFPPRDVPRGPKGLIDAPTGPRSNTYSSDYRGDFGGFRGDLRGRGRARGRGGWRDDSRDRGREPERDYRDRRDDRAPTRESFRGDERGRGVERWDQDSIRGRRASPPNRGRSPGYATRDARDTSVPDLIDRRPSREGPLAAASPLSDGPSPFARGYTRPRGGRGQGRGGYYNEFHGRQPGRSRSPDPPTTYRRNRPSATPPPQVPAFGSTSNNIPLVTVAPIAPSVIAPSLSTPITDTPPVSIPTAPRAASHNVPNPPAIASIATPVPSTPSIPTAPRSSISNTSLPPATPTAPASFSHEPIPGVSVPTAPRGRTSFGRPNHQPTSMKWVKPKDTALDSRAGETIRNSSVPVSGPEATLQTGELRQISKSQEPEIIQRDGTSKNSDETVVETKTALVPEEKSDQPANQSLQASTEPIELFPKTAFEEPSKGTALEQHKDEPPISLEPKRAPVSGRRAKKEAAATLLNELPDDGSDSDEGDFDDHYFEVEIGKTESKIAEAMAHNPLAPSKLIQQVVFYAKPWLSNVNVQRSVEDCVAPVIQMTAPIIPSPTNGTTLAPKPNIREKSRPVSPLPDHDANLSSVKADDLQQHGETSQDLRPINGDGFPSLPPAVSKYEEAHVTKTLAVNGAKEVAEEETKAEEHLRDLASVRKMMTTPPISSLPTFDCGLWYNDKAFVASLEVRNSAVDEKIQNNIRAKSERIAQEQKEECEKYKQRYLDYRKWTDFSDDVVAVRSREKFAASRVKRAAEAAAPATSGNANAGAKSEGRRTGRWATEHDFERVLRESEQEAKESKAREDRDVRARTANAKEATIPDMIWDSEEYDKKVFIDKTRLVPFERSFARLEYAEPIDNFDAEEWETFEKIYLENPKQWTTIADALPKRDYKACIQHYYKVKHSSNLKEKFKKQSKKRGKGKNLAKGPKPKSNALMADLRDEGEDGPDNDTGGEQKRRPRRAAAPTWPINETPQSESEVASPAPQGRKAAATPKGDSNTEAAPAKRGRGKGTQNKGSAKQAKLMGGQLLAAAPIAAANRRDDSPANPNPGVIADFNITPRPSVAAPRFTPQYDGTGASPLSFVPTAFLPSERQITAMPLNFEPPQQSYPPQEQLDSVPPRAFDPQPDRRIATQTSSYWSVPETTDFLMLLRHFGTDWQGIAKFMTTKTHIMVQYKSNFEWLTMPSDSNKSRRVANVLSQVKNFYQRQVEAGKRDWLEAATEADEKKKRGEPTGPLPQAPQIQPKRKYELSSGPVLQGSVVDELDNMPVGVQVPTMSQASPQQPVLSNRFPPLARAGSVPHQSAVSTSNMSKHMTPQPIQQAPPQIQQIQQVQQIQQAQQAQQAHQQQRNPRGPSLGFFNTERPPLQSDQLSQRSLRVAQEAEMERASALRLEREQREQHQQQALQRERQFQLKQENETPNPHQFEAYPTPANHHSNNLLPQQRMEVQQAQPIPVDHRRSAIPQPSMQQTFQPRNHTHVRNILSESLGNREIKSSPSPAVPQATMIAPPQNKSYPPPSQLSHSLQPHQSHQPQQIHQQQPHQSQQVHQPPIAQQVHQPPIAQQVHQPSIAQQTVQLPVAAPPRQQETIRKKSNLMDLLNSDEPSEPRPAPPKRLSDVSTSVQQRSHTPTSQHPLQPSRYINHSPHPSHTSQPTSQPQHPVPQQLASQAGPQHMPQPRHSYQQAAHPIHQHSASIEHPRSYTPTGFDNRAYAPPQVSQSQQQQMFSQAPRQPSNSQAPPIRREPSLGDMHGGIPNYARTSAPSQPSMRAKDSPYSGTPTHSVPNGRQPGGSPMDQPIDRDYYPTRPSIIMQQQQQQQSATSSPQLGPSYHQAQQSQGSLQRHNVYSQSQAHTASPTTSYAPSRPVQRSRQSSFDGGSGGGRYSIPTSSAPTTKQHGFSQPPQHQPAQVSMHYQQQAHPVIDRHEFDPQRDRERRQHQAEYERRIQQEEYQRRFEEQRR